MSSASDPGPSKGFDALRRYVGVMMSGHPVQLFEVFYDEVKDRVFRVVLLIGRRPIQAEGAVAEAFASAWPRWDTVGRLSNPTAWVVRAAIKSYNSDLAHLAP